MDHVHFAVTSASEMACGESHVVSVWVFPEPRHKDLAERALAEHGTDYQISSTGPAEFEYGSTLQLRLKVEGLEVTEPDRTVLWVRDLGKATYAIRIPGNARIGTHAGRVSVRFAGFEVAVLDFTLVVGAKTKRTWSAEPQVTRYRTGFASYASRDRAEVLARVQGLEKAGVDVFVDVKDLRSGDRYAERLFEAISRRDVLYLFWSKAASRSRWVEREWRYAYDRRGIDFIDPVPLVHPEQVPPPEELIDAVHFRDWVLAWTASPRPRLRRRSLLRRLLRK